MSQRISTIDVRQRIGDMLNRVALRRDEFVIERKRNSWRPWCRRAARPDARCARRQALDFVREQNGAGGLTDKAATDLVLEAEAWARKPNRKCLLAAGVRPMTGSDR